MAKPVTLNLSAEEADAVESILGHALDQAHDTMERDYLQYLVDGGLDVFEPNEDREAELEETVLAVQKRIVEGWKA